EVGWSPPPPTTREANRPRSAPVIRFLCPYRSEQCQVPADSAVGAVIAFTACDKDCLAVLARAMLPVSGEKIHQALDRAGILYGLVTVKRSLAKRKRLGLNGHSQALCQTLSSLHRSGPPR